MRYPFAFHDVSWTPDVALGPLFWRTVCQVYNRMEVTWLPVYEPSAGARVCTHFGMHLRMRGHRWTLVRCAEEVADARVFATGVRARMAAAVRCDTIDLSNYDAFTEKTAVDLGYGDYAFEHIISQMKSEDVRRVRAVP